MKRNIATALFSIVVLVMAGFVTAADAKPVGTPETLNQQVGHQLSMLNWYGVFDFLQYQVNGTEVILSGDVTSEHEQTKFNAQKAVRRIPGVTKVVNNIQVLPPSPFDSQIRRAEYRTIFSRGDLGRYTLGVIPQVHIVVDRGHVTLDGTVINQMDRTMAGIVAKTVPGVFSVTNNLTVNG